MDTDINCVFQGLGTIGAIYISNSKAANNINILSKLNIKAVITAAKGRKIQYPPNSISKYMYLQIQDHQKFQIQRYFNQTFQFIQQCRKFTNILIHCHAGASRSVAIVIAYLIRKYNYSLSQIYTLLKRKRSKIQPNPGFIQQLQKYSQKHSVKQNGALNKQISASKKVKRSISLYPQFSFPKNEITQTAKNSIKSQQLRQKAEQIKQKSQELKQKYLKKQNKHELQQQQTQKISRLHKQRNQIQQKINNLRHGLIKGTCQLGKKRKNLQNTKIKIKDQPQLIQLKCFQFSQKLKMKKSAQQTFYSEMSKPFKSQKQYDHQNHNPNIQLPVYSKQIVSQKAIKDQFNTNFSISVSQEKSNPSTMISTNSMIDNFSPKLHKHARSFTSKNQVEV